MPPLRSRHPYETLPQSTEGAQGLRPPKGVSDRPSVVRVFVLVGNRAWQGEECLFTTNFEGGRIGTKT